MKHNNQHGAVAVFLASIIAILLFVSTTSAARLTISDLSQASQIDRSEEAYYAAEAGIEDASRRIDLAPADATIDTIFPAQFNGCNNPSCQDGDRADLSGDISQFLSIVFDPFTTADLTFDRAWRHRRVLDDSVNLAGVQLKDESIQLDTTQLRRKCNTSAQPAGGDGKDCDGTDIFSHFGGIQYCWQHNQPAPPTANMEFSMISYPASNPGDILTEKVITTGTGSDGHARTVTVVNNVPVDSTTPLTDLANARCVQIRIDGGQNVARRYIFRVKPLFTTGSDQAYSVGYFKTLLNEAYATPDNRFPNQLYDKSGNFLIDVTGQAGEIRRRLVAKKFRGDRVLGIFDYVIFSGSPTLPLCKPGIQQTDRTYDALCVPTTNPPAN